MRFCGLVAIFIWLALWPSKQILANTEAEQKVCSALLDKSNIVWSEIGTRDDYSLNTPPGFTTPTWEKVNYKYVFQIHSAVFDFFNDGTPTTVYSASFDNGRIYYYHFIVAAPGEEDLLRERISSVNDGETLAALEADLVHVTDIKFGATANKRYLQKEQSSPMKSVLYDASNTSTYGGWYTSSQVFLYQGRTYLAGMSNGSPSITIFTPGKAGLLNPICSHNGEPSRKENVITSLGKTDFACPASVKERPVEWDGKHDQVEIFDIPEWGGKRPVKQRVIPMGNQAEIELYIGPVNASVADKDNIWMPLASLDQEYGVSRGLALTDKGPYISVWSDDPTGYTPAKTTYYRIDKNALVPVCDVFSKTIPPSGYANTKGEKTEN